MVLNREEELLESLPKGGRLAATVTIKKTIYTPGGELDLVFGSVDELTSTSAPKTKTEVTADESDPQPVSTANITDDSDVMEDELESAGLESENVDMDDGQLRETEGAGGDDQSTSGDSGEREALEEEAKQVVEWDGDAELDEDLLYRILNNGGWMPSPDPGQTFNRQQRDALEVGGYLIDLAAELNVSSAVCYRAAEIYAAARRHGLIAGQGKIVTAAAAIRLASLEEDEHRPVKIISTVLDEACSGSELVHKQHILLSELDLSPMLIPIQPQDYLPYLASRLEMRDGHPIIQKAAEIIGRAETSQGGKSSWVVAASAIYAASIVSNADKLTQGTVSDAACISEVSIRNTYKDLLNADES